MYSACLHCTKDLGTNETFATFPTGRRLAYDPARGRLWVVCPACARWNLTPLEERWEAIDQAERRQETARHRVATDNVSLTRLPEGTELVRIGGPSRNELAVWRYGDAFHRRRKKALITTGAVIGGIGAAIAGATFAGMSAFAMIGIGNGLERYYREGPQSKVLTRLRVPGDGSLLHITPRDVRAMRLLDGAQGLSLQIDYGAMKSRHRQYSSAVTFTGAVARDALQKILPGVNRMGGTRPQIDRAVARLEEAGDAERYFAHLARTHGLHGGGAEPTPMIDRFMGASGKAAGLYAIPRTVALAIEMATHEDRERRALEGELAELEAAWKDAEEIAKIADDMFVPPRIDDALGALKGRRKG